MNFLLKALQFPVVMALVSMQVFYLLYLVVYKKTDTIDFQLYDTYYVFSTGLLFLILVISILIFGLFVILKRK